MHIAEPSALDFVILHTTPTVNCTYDHRNNRGEIGSRNRSRGLSGRPMLLDIPRVGPDRVVQDTRCTQEWRRGLVSFSSSGFIGAKKSLRNVLDLKKCWETPLN